MPIWTDLYSNLWSLLLDQSIQRDHIIIPETVVLEGSDVVEWYIPDTSKGGLFKRQINKSVVNAEVLKSLLSNKQGDCMDGVVATMIWYSPKQKHASTPNMRYFNAMELKALLLGTELIELPLTTWLLQAFVPPFQSSATPTAGTCTGTGSSSNCNFVTMCCEHVGIRKNLSQIQNKHKYNPLPGHLSSLITVEGGSSNVNTLEIPRISPRFSTLALSITDTCEIAMKKGGNNGSISGVKQPNFKIYMRPQGSKLVILFSNGKVGTSNFKGKGKSRGKKSKHVGSVESPGNVVVCDGGDDDFIDEDWGYPKDNQINNNNSNNSDKSKMAENEIASVVFCCGEIPLSVINNCFSAHPSVKTIKPIITTIPVQPQLMQLEFSVSVTAAAAAAISKTTNNNIDDDEIRHNGVEIQYTVANSDVNSVYSALLEIYWRNIECVNVKSQAQAQAHTSTGSLAILYKTEQQRMVSESSAFRLSSKFNIKIKSILAQCPKTLEYVHTQKKERETSIGDVFCGSGGDGSIGGDLLGLGYWPQMGSDDKKTKSGGATDWGVAWDSAGTSNNNNRKQAEPAFAPAYSGYIERRPSRSRNPGNEENSKRILSGSGSGSLERESSPTLTLVSIHAPSLSPSRPKQPLPSSSSAIKQRPVSGATKRTESLAMHRSDKRDLKTHINIRSGAQFTGGGGGDPVFLQPEWQEPSYRSYAEEFAGYKDKSKSSSNSNSENNHLKIGKGNTRPASAGPLQFKNNGHLLSGATATTAVNRVRPSSALSPRDLGRAGTPTKSSLMPDSGSVGMRSGNDGDDYNGDLFEYEVNEEDEDEEDDFIASTSTSLFPAHKKGGVGHGNRKPGRMTLMESKMGHLHRPDANNKAGSIHLNANANASNGTQWAAQVSNNSNTTTNSNINRNGKKSNSKVQYRVGSTAPSVQAEHLLDIILSIVNSVCVSFAKDLMGTLPLADTHRSTVCTAMKQQQQQETGPENENVLSENNNDSNIYINISEAKSDQTHLAIAKVVRQLSMLQMGNVKAYGERAQAANAIGLEQYELAREAANVQLHRVPGAIPFASCMELLLCTPNHRPVEQLTTIFLWLLSSDRGYEHFSDMSISKMTLKGFKSHLTSVREDLARYTLSQSSRGGSNSSTESSTGGGSKRLGQLTQDLRTLLTPVVQETDIPFDSVEAIEVSRHSPSRGHGHVNDDRNGNGILPNTPNKLSAVLDKWESNEKSGSRSNEITSKFQSEQYSQLAESGTTSPRHGHHANGTNNNDDNNTTGQVYPRKGKRYKRVKVHIGMQTMLSALKWSQDGPTFISPELIPKSVLPRSARASVNEENIDSYQFPDGQGGKGQLLVSDPNWPQIVVTTNNIPIPGDTSTSTSASANTNTNTGVVGTSSNTSVNEGGKNSFRKSNSTKTTKSQATTTPTSKQPHVYIGSPKGTLAALVPLEREVAFYKCAPPLCGEGKQRHVLLVSLLSDIARNIILHISLLARHVWSGNSIKKEDICKLLGWPVIYAMGKTRLERLHNWLHANCRTSSSFKLGNEFLLEVSLHRIYAYWPQLSLQLQSDMNALHDETLQSIIRGASANVNKNKNKNPKKNKRKTKQHEWDIDTDDEDEEAQKNKSENGGIMTGGLFDDEDNGLASASCVAALTWIDRLGVEALFKDPLKLYRPNANVI
jgi:hypothetical protein